MRQTTVLLLIIVLGLSLGSNAQVKGPSIDFVPQSPTAAAYSRYGDIPIDHSTGVPRIEIPFHKVKIGDTEVPISISYHSGGNKVRDVASEVGLGFVLNYGGVVTANILGYSDFSESKPLFKTSQQIYDSILTARSAGTDENLAFYYWQLLNGNMQRDFFSDRFYYSLSDGEAGHFRKDYVSDSIRFLPFRPVKVNLSYPRINIISSNGLIHDFIDKGSKDYFVLEKLTSPNLSDSIKYFYTNRSTTGGSMRYELMWKYQNTIVNPYNNCILMYQNSYAGEYHVSRDNSGGVAPSALIDSIVSNDEVVIFNYVVGRSEVQSTGFRLKEMKVKNRKSGEIIKLAKFFHSYFGTALAQNQRLRLDSIYLYGPDTTVYSRYAFQYNDIQLPKYPISEVEQYYEDYWGYYNGAAKDNLFPHFFSGFNIPGSNLSFSNMEPSPVFSKACLLTRISYPTGGYSEFDHEANCVDGIVGGVRIKEIRSKTESTSNAVVKRYEYLSGSARPILSGNFRYEKECFVGLQGRDEAGDPDCEVFIGSYTKHIGSSSSYVPIVINGGANIVYTSVREYLGDDQTNTGKIEYAYHWEDYDIRNPRPGSVYDYHISPFHSDGGNYHPQLITKRIYERTGSTYKLQQEEVNDYSRLKVKEFNTGVNFSIICDVTYENITVTPEQVFEVFHDWYDYFNYLAYSDTKGYQEVDLISKKTIREVSSNGDTLTKVIDYSYDDKFALLKTQTSFSSDGSIKSIHNTYPSDVQNFPYDKMVERNQISTVVKARQYTDGSLISTDSLVMGFWKNSTWKSTAEPGGAFLPRKLIETSPGLNSASEMEFISYDWRGNLTSAKSNGGEITSFIWGYGGLYPVIKATGVNLETLLSHIDTNIIKNPISDSVLRAEILALQHTLKDSVAFIEGFTFRPSVGVTSKVFQNGDIELYQYDGMGRLSFVFDKNKRIKKRICYNFSGQPEDCKVYYNVQKSQSFTKNCGTGFNPPPYLYVVPANRYAALSQSAADSLAQVDINLNGQHWADSLSTCPTVYYSASINQNFYKTNCPSGYTASAYPVTVAYGYSTSTISQVYVDSVAQDYAQSYADANGGCISSGGGLPYVRLELEAGASYDNSSGYVVDYGQQVAAYIRFYADSNCTVPFTLTASVNYAINVTGYYETDINYTASSYELYAGSISNGVSSFLFDDMLSYYGFFGEFEDPGPWIYYEKWKDDYYLTPNPSQYTLRPTIRSINYPNEY